jgi:type I restriction enzyme S subunit
MTNKPQFVGECRRVKLNEICSKGKSSLRQKDVINDGPYSVYGASGVVGTTSDYQNEIPYVAVVKDGAGVGRANACEPMTSVLGTMQALIPNPNVERDYLLYLVRSLRLGGGFSGSTIPHIYFKDYGKIEVLLPSLEAQKRIVSQLGLIEAQIEQAEAQITQLDQLVKSRFVEMFGDPISNSKGLETQPGSALFKIVNGKTKPMDERYETGFPAYGGNGVSWYSLDSLVDFPTIVVGRVGRHCGNARLVNDPCWVTDNAMYIKRFYSNELDLIYLDELMRVVGFNRYADRGDLWKITQQPFMEFNYPMPPLAQQQEFAASVRQVDKSRFVYLGGESGELTLESERRNNDLHFG